MVADVEFSLDYKIIRQAILSYLFVQEESTCIRQEVRWDWKHTDAILLNNLWYV